MTQQFFVSLPVKDLEKSRDFYAALGGTINPQFSGNGSACMVFADNFFVMLSNHEKWASFTTKPVVKGSMALGLTVTTRAAVDAMIAAAAARGGKTDPGAPEDHGFMYQRSIEDPDGHHWEITWMDVSQMPKQS